MKRVIYKYQLKIGDFEIDLPECADHVFVHCGIQSTLGSQRHSHDGLYVWFSVEPELIAYSILKPFKFKMIATGNDFDDRLWKVHGSIVDNHNGYVWHLLEERLNQDV